MFYSTIFTWVGMVSTVASWLMSMKGEHIFSLFFVIIAIVCLHVSLEAASALDDEIKELRKELKSLKEQTSDPDS